jgi:2-keto-4-pentenoate hydratase/2-oxohepta-3-ene-1,7-dioic acid hydratase in catechol pathway
MKLARCLIQGKETYGCFDSRGIVSLPVLASRLGEKLSNGLEELIAQEEGIENAEAILSKATTNDVKAASVRLAEVTLLAPIAWPPKILCLGWNYKTHIAETKREMPEEPVVFMKPHTAIVGSGEPIVKRPFVKELDYEGELTIVMGKKAKDVDESEAMNYVFGYTIMNDVSARDFQFRDKQWTRGKGFDTFAPMGPCITTKKELRDPSNLSLKTWVNDELRQNGNTADMIFTVSQIVYHLSRVMTLEPCDVIATGTPSGVAMAMKPQRWLQSGDVVRIEIGGIGTLENPVREG